MVLPPLSVWLSPLSVSLSLSFSVSLSPSLSLTVCLSVSVSLSLSLSLTHTHTHAQVTCTLMQVHLRSLLMCSSDRLSAQDILTVRKVLEYVYPKVYGEEGKVDKDGTKIDCTDCLELLCNDQVRI